MNNQPNQAQWPISNDDKKVIQDLGRKLHKFILEYADANKQSNGGFHWKIMAGAFQYVEGVMGQKQAMLAEDILILRDTVEKYSLGDRIDEPFQQTPNPSMEEMRAAAEKKKAEAQAELDMIEAATAPAVEATPEVTPATTELGATPNDQASVASATAKDVPSPYPASTDPGAATA